MGALPATVGRQRVSPLRPVASPATTSDPSEAAGAMARHLELQEDIALDVLRRACRTRMAFVPGKEAIRVNNERAGRGMTWSAFRNGLNTFLWMCENSRTGLAHLDIVDKIVRLAL